MKSSIGESFMEIQFENLEEAELIVNCIYKVNNLGLIEPSVRHG